MSTDAAAMKGLFITFEGTEGGGKSTQIQILAERLRGLGHVVRTLREPGGTPIGEEIRHTVQHSDANHAMTAEAELLLINASRAQLVREIIRPALARGEIVLCDRFYDSTTAYQGWGRQLDLEKVKSIIDFAVEDTRPDLTLLLEVPIEVSEIRRQTRLQTPSTSPSSATSKSPPKVEGSEPVRDRMEEGDRAFFKRVQRGFEAIATEEPARVRVIDGTQPIEAVAGIVWREVEKILQPRPTPSVR